MSRRKKIVCLWVMLALTLIALAGCEPDAAEKGRPIRVAILQLSQNRSFTDMREGFMQGLRELGYKEEKLEFLCYDAGGSTATLHHILNSLDSEGVDLLVPLVTSATQAAVNLDSGIPIIFISVTDPVGAGIMGDLSAPNRNATGTCNRVPLAELFQLAECLTPGIKIIGVLYDPGLPNSVLTVERAREYFTQTGVACVERTITGSSEVQATAQALAEMADAIYVPIDSTVLSAMPQVVEAAKQAGKPVYGSAPSMVTSGALASISVSEWETGRQSALLAHEYLQGIPIGEIPALVVDDYLTVINTETAKALGVSIPDEIAAMAQLVEGQEGQEGAQ